MSSETPVKRMTPVHGVRALAVATLAEVTGTTASPDHAIAVALIAGAAGVIGVFVQTAVTDWLRDRRHKPHYTDEQAALNELLIEQLAERNAELERLRAETGKRRSRRTEK